MPKQFQYCRVCRRNHDQGRGHLYSVKHKQCLDVTLSQCRKKFEGIRYFLKNVIPVASKAPVSAKLWCTFCEQDIDEQQSAFMCAKAIKHLGSQMHSQNVKTFWAENGVKDEEQRLYVIDGIELAHWEEACEVVPAVEHLDGPMATVSMIDNQSKQNYGPMVTVSATDGQLKQNFTQGASENSGPRESLVADLTVLRVPLLKPGEGNVHSGAAPPWLKQSMGEGTPVILPTSHMLPLSRTQERKLAKVRNPNRVGAAWAEMRRTQLEREKSGEPALMIENGGSSWFPSFGRVWQSGSRRDTRKEFEAEKKWEKKKQGRSVDPGKKSCSRLAIQPYISKKMRKEMETNHE